MKCRKSYRSGGMSQMGKENVRSLEGAEIKYLWLLTLAEIPLLALAGLQGQLLASQLSSAPMGKGNSPREAAPIEKESIEQQI